MKKNNKGKTVKILKGEKLLYMILILLVIALPISNVFTKALLSETNIDLEKMKNKIEEQSSINESLNMQINELASLDKIQEVAKDIGLSYNNDNIKIVTDSN
jgi:cell division protein FtsL